MSARPGRIVAEIAPSQEVAGRFSSGYAALVGQVSEALRA